MSVLIAGTLWTSLVTYLLLRVLRQSRVHSAGSLKPEMPRRGPVSVSIILSVRNETARVGACLQALLAQTGLGAGSEIVVVDDDSTDGTVEQVARLAAADPWIKLIRSGPLPAGWMGKPRACWCAAMQAEGDWICFVDAGVRAAPDLVATAIAAANEHSVDLLSLSPFQELGSFWERLIVPVGLVLIGCAMDLHRIDDPAAPDVSASGQFLLFRRDAYFAVGGHAAVRGEICEDKALAGRVKRAGMRFRLLGGEHLARTRMYTDLASLWDIATVILAMSGLILSWTAAALPVWSALVLAGGPSAPQSGGSAFQPSDQPRLGLSLSEISVSTRIGRLAIAKTLWTLSIGIASFSASSSGVGSRPISGSIWCEVRTTLLTVSTILGGTRVVSAWPISVSFQICRRSGIRTFSKMRRPGGRSTGLAQCRQRTR